MAQFEQSLEHHMLDEEPDMERLRAKALNDLKEICFPCVSMWRSLNSVELNWGTGAEMAWPMKTFVILCILLYKQTGHAEDGYELPEVSGVAPIPSFRPRALAQESSGTLV